MICSFAGLEHSLSKTVSLLVSYSVIRLQHKVIFVSSSSFVSPGSVFAACTALWKMLELPLISLYSPEEVKNMCTFIEIYMKRQCIRQMLSTILIILNVDFWDHI